MNLFENILVDMLYISFPLIVYLIYLTFKKTLEKEKSDLVLDIAIISSIYLLIKFGGYSNCGIIQLFLNIPLLIAYKKKRELSIVFISIIIIYQFYSHFNFSIIYLIVEYLMYYIIYYIIKYKEIENSIFSKIFIYLNILLYLVGMSIFFNHFITNVPELLYSILYLFGFGILSAFSVYLFKISEDVLLLHRNMKEIDDEKKINESLFKITHEIKNPIAVCKGYLDMFDVNNIEHSKKYIPIIKEEISRLLFLLEDFLSINRIKIQKDIIDINMLLEEVTKKYIPILNSRNIEYELLFNDDEFYIEADYNRLNQVVLNILKNSVESIPQGQLGCLKINTKIRRNEIKIFIEDNGAGITKENLSKMKEPFFSTKNRGAGLGVFLSNEIIKAHNGSLKYLSKENKGTKAVITLPIGIKKRY
ncbi:MAG: ATP-binding protein [Bacilli bacterium]